jgi:hypothetical protein
VILLVTALQSLGLAAVIATLLDYSITDVYRYAFSEFAFLEVWSYIFFVMLYAPAFVALWLALRVLRKV